jgi:hypothetical protein
MEDTLLSAVPGAANSGSPEGNLSEAAYTHPLGNAQGAQAFHGVQVEVILCFASDLFLVPSSGVI